MDCRERTCIITGSTGKVIGSKCIMCKGSKTAEGQQLEAAEQGRGVCGRSGRGRAPFSRITRVLDIPLVSHRLQ